MVGASERGCRFGIFLCLFVVLLLSLNNKEQQGSRKELDVRCEGADSHWRMADKVKSKGSRSSFRHRKRHFPSSYPCEGHPSVSFFCRFLFLDLYYLQDMRSHKQSIRCLCTVHFAMCTCAHVYYGDALFPIQGNPKNSKIDPQQCPLGE